MTTAAAERHRRELRSAVLPGALLMASAAVLLASFFRALALAARLAQTSDSAQGFVVGHALASGNLLLTGWRFPLDDYYFTDAVPYAVLELILGVRRSLLALEPALLYAAYTAVAIFACVGQSRPPKRKLEAVAILAIFVSAPVWIGSWNPLLLSDMHVATAIGAFVVLVLAARLPELEPRRKRIPHAVAICALTAAIVASDPFAIVFAFAPALLVLAWEAIRCRAAVATMAALGFGIVLGWLLPQVVAAAGGFATQNDVIGRFVAAPLFTRNLEALLGCLLRNFGIVLDGNRLSARSVVVSLLRCAAFAIAIAAMARTARRMGGPHRAERLDLFLLAGVLVLFAACAASAQFGKGIVPERGWDGGPPMRYLVPAYLFGAALAARAFPDILSYLSWRAGAAARTVLLVCAAIDVFAGGWLSGIAAQPRWIDNNPPAAAARWLEQRGLLQGVGEYWSANLVTALSGERVQVRSVVPERRRLVPYIWVEDARWYKRPPQFAIWQEPNKTGVATETVRATYAVCQIVDVAGYRIAVLNCRSFVGRPR